MREDLARIILELFAQARTIPVRCPDLMVPGIGAADRRREEQDPVDEKERKGRNSQVAWTEAMNEIRTGPYRAGPGGSRRPPSKADGLAMAETV